MPLYLVMKLEAAHGRLRSLAACRHEFGKYVQVPEVRWQ